MNCGYERAHWRCIIGELRPNVSAKSIRSPSKPPRFRENLGRGLVFLEKLGANLGQTVARHGFLWSNMSQSSSGLLVGRLSANSKWILKCGRYFFSSVVLR